MGARYLTDLPDVLVAAGLAVTVQADWETRARSSGGFDGNRPWAIMWHHAASAPGASAASVANYASYGSDTAPICNLVLGRDGAVIVCAAGATNTNGKGGPLELSLGRVPADQMNTHAISIEAVNTGVGEPWPAAQMDAYFAINNALAAAYGLAPGDCCTHNVWAPGRKIDPATAAAVQGEWRPASTTTSGTWSLDDIRTEAAARWQGDDDMTPEQAAQLQQIADTVNALAVNMWGGPEGTHPTWDESVQGRLVRIEQTVDGLWTGQNATNTTLWDGPASVIGRLDDLQQRVAVLEANAGVTATLESFDEPVLDTLPDPPP